MVEGGQGRRLRRLIQVGLLLLAAIAVAIGTAVVNAYRARPNIAVDYAVEAQRLSMEHQPKGEDAWPMIAACLEELNSIEEQLLEEQPELVDRFPDYPSYSHITDYAPPEEGEFPEVEVIRRLRRSNFFDRAAEAASAPRCIPAFRPGLALHEWPFEGNFAPALTRLIAATMRLAVLEGQLGQVDGLLGTNLGVIRHQSWYPLAIHRLGAESSYMRLMRELSFLLNDAEFNEPQCFALLATLGEGPEFAPEFLAIEGERLVMRDVIQHIFTDDGEGNGRLILSEAHRLEIDVPGGGHPLSNVAAPFFASRRETTDIVESRYRELVEIMETSREDRAPHIRDWWDRSPGAGLRMTIPAVLEPGSAMYPIDWQGSREAHLTVRLMLALECHFARHGSWPASLSEIDESIIGAVPTDPRNGKAFGYRIRAPQPDDPRPYLLYSFGMDGVDNGGTVPDEHRGLLGQMHPEYNTAALSEAGAGYDYILNPPRTIEDYVGYDESWMHMMTPQRDQ